MSLVDSCNPNCTFEEEIVENLNSYKSMHNPIIDAKPAVLNSYRKDQKITNYQAFNFIQYYHKTTMAYFIKF